MFAEAAYMNTHRDIGEAYSAGCSLLWMLCVCVFRSAASAHEWLHWLQVASSAGKENRRLLDWDQLMLLQLKVNPLSGDLAQSFQSSKLKVKAFILEKQSEMVHLHPLLSIQCPCKAQQVYIHYYPSSQCPCKVQQGHTEYLLSQL